MTSPVLNPQTAALVLHERFGLDLIRKIEAVAVPDEARALARTLVLGMVQHAQAQRAVIEAREAVLQ